MARLAVLPGAVAGSAVLAIAVTVADRPWWALVIGWLSCFSVTVAVARFVRTVVEGYREP